MVLGRVPAGELEVDYLDLLSTRASFRQPERLTDAGRPVLINSSRPGVLRAFLPSLLYVATALTNGGGDNLTHVRDTCEEHSGLKWRELS